MNGPGSRVRSALRCGSLLVVVAFGESLASRDACADDVITYEVRQQVTGALLPSHDYGVTGLCATGSGLVPASIYAHGGSGRGEGLGFGIGGRAAFEHMDLAPGGSSSWWGFRAALGLDLDLLYARVDTGIADMSGKLCARVKSDGAEVQYRGSSVLFLQMPAFVGAEMAFGRVTDDPEAGWRGVVLAAGWAPAMTFVKPWVAHADFDPSFLGTEVTLDFATFSHGAAIQDRKRAAVFLLLPPQDRGPVIITLSFGAVWR
jgi:hypothetical protein